MGRSHPLLPLSEAVVRFVHVNNEIELRNKKTRANFVIRADALFELEVHARLIDRGRSAKSHIEATEFDPL